MEQEKDREGPVHGMDPKTGIPTYKGLPIWDYEDSRASLRAELSRYGTPASRGPLAEPGDEGPARGLFPPAGQR